MIWESIILMTIIDLSIVGFSIFAFWIFYSHKKTLDNLGFSSWVFISLSGLAIIAAFYLFDLAVMFLFPLFIPKKNAMEIMTNLHLNYSWLVTLTGVGLIVLGFVYRMKFLFPKLEILISSLEEARAASEKDIAERAKSEETLKKTEQRLNRAQEIGKVGTWDWNPNTGELIWSDEIFRILGYSPNEVVPLYELFLERIHPDDMEFLNQSVEEALYDNKLYNLDCRVISKNGLELIANARGEVIFDESGKPMQMLGTFQDITERKRIEEELRFYSEISRNMSDGINLVGAADGVLLYTNPKFNEIFGYDDGELLGKHVSVLNAKEDEFISEEFLKNIMECLNKKGGWNGEVNNKKKDNTLFWTYASIVKFRHFKFGDCYLSVQHDITERKRAEEELERLASVVKYSSELVNMSTLDGTMIFINKAGSKMLGIDPKEVGHVNIMEVIPDHLKEIVEQKLLPELMKGGTWEGELEYRNLKTGKLTVVHAIIFSVKDHVSKKPIYLANISRDISMQKKVESEMRAAKEEAELANHTKSDFLANMSHEIRTPMNVIIGMADLLREDVLTPEQEKKLSKLSKSCDFLLDLINNILDLSKIEAGHLELEEAAFNLKNLLAEIESLMGVEARAKGLKLSFHLEPKVPERFIGDSKRLRQILFNLGSNAIKFTEKGSVAINVRKIEVSNDIVELEFCVKDTGIGIQRDKLDVIFYKFTQSDSSTSREYGGTGLGTTIAKMFVEKMGGRIWAESEVGEGSTFFFTVKLKADKISEDEKTINKEAFKETLSWKRPLNILLVEDSEDNIMLMQLYLEKTPHVIEIAVNGKIAVEKFQSGNYDVVLMDLEMPVMDGYSATKEIRKWEAKEEKDPIPILALTAHALNEHKQKSLAAGCTGHISKPIKKHMFLDALYEYTNKSLEF